MNTPTRTCTKCSHELPATREFFGLQKTGKYGLASRCKTCVKGLTALWRVAHPEYMDAYRVANADRLAEHGRLYRIANSEERAEYNRAYCARNPDRYAAYNHNRKALKNGNGGIHTAEDVKAQYGRQRGRCFYCREKVSGQYHVDHVVPLALGGSNGPESLVISCPTCNLRKKDKSPMDFCGRLL